MEKTIKIVVKIEIETLFDNNGNLSFDKVEQVSMVCANLQNSGVKILLVSSGAIKLGSARLGMNTPPDSIAVKQAVAAVGQAELIILYQKYFEVYDQTVAQILLTKDVIDNKLRNKNAKNTLIRLLEKGIIPVINENDSVSTNDIIYNDNYPLVLIVASLTNADAIVVNTFNGDKFQLIVKNTSLIREINVDELMLLSELINSGKLLADEDIRGFPDFVQPVGLS